MPRVGRKAPGGLIYHVFNRGNGRQRIFRKPADYDAFLEIIAHVSAFVPVRVLALCLMPNHWHLVLWPEHDGELSRFMLRLTTTHVRRYFKHHGVEGGGHLYQGRFKSFPVQDDFHLLVLLRYVESNARRAKLVPRAEQWRWCSVALRGTPAAADLLTAWPVALPGNWLDLINEPLPERDVQSLHTSLTRGRPFGSEPWVEKTARKLDLQFTLRPRGRPATKPVATKTKRG